MHSLFANNPILIKIRLLSAAILKGSGRANLDKLPMAEKRTLNIHHNFSIMLRFDI